MEAYEEESEYGYTEDGQLVDLSTSVVDEGE